MYRLEIDDRQGTAYVSRFVAKIRRNGRLVGFGTDNEAALRECSGDPPVVDEVAELRADIARRQAEEPSRVPEESQIVVRPRVAACNRSAPTAERSSMRHTHIIIGSETITACRQPIDIRQTRRIPSGSKTTQQEGDCPKCLDELHVLGMLERALISFE